MATFKCFADVPKLGFGTMRLPLVPGTQEIDMAAYQAMADVYMQHGMNYFDTAYMYHDYKSEGAFKEAVAARYPREAYALATKLPIWEAKTREDVAKLFETQLARTGAGYFDFYLHHCLNKAHDEQSIALGAYDTVKQLKADGKIGHIGFSFHGDAAALKKVLREQPQMEFVQLMLNYLDWDGEAGEFYRIVRAYNLPIIIMEPVRGGALSKLPVAAAKALDETGSKDSYASWAMRWCAGLEGVATILSGMSNMEQMLDNLATIEHFKPLSEAEEAVTRRVAAIIHAINPVPCTECRYCANCPGGVQIPELFAAYNKWIENNSMGDLGRALEKIPASRQAADCVACGQCESVCPQGINIIERLKELAHLTA